MRGMSPEMEDQMKQEARSDYTRFLIAVLLATPPVAQGQSGFEFLFEKEMEMKDGKVDALRVIGPNDFVAFLLIDQKTLRPWELIYRAPAQRGQRGPQGAPNAQRPEEESDGPKLADYQLFFSEHKQFDKVWLPQRIVKASGGQMLEEWKLNKYKLNPEIKPNRFEKKK
jgi:hypothetical protein